jgi:hypothetical protein
LVIAITAMQLVVVVPAIEDVVAVAADQPVVADQAIERVVAVLTRNPVRAIGAGQDIVPPGLPLPLPLAMPRTPRIN